MRAAAGCRLRQKHEIHKDPLHIITPEVLRLDDGGTDLPIPVRVVRPTPTVRHDPRGVGPTYDPATECRATEQVLVWDVLQTREDLPILVQLSDVLFGDEWHVALNEEGPESLPVLQVPLHVGEHLLAARTLR